MGQFRQQSSTIDVKRTRLIYFGYPDGEWTKEGWNFAQQFGEAARIVHSPYIPARNLAVRELVLPVLNEFDNFVFMDRDIRPGEKTLPFLDENAADIVGCEYKLKSPTAWLRTDNLHSGFWRAKSEVFRRLEAPWFLWEYSHDGCELLNCDCNYFCRKANAAGLTIARAGFADHDEHRSWEGCT